jgi:hypothetical protein
MGEDWAKKDAPSCAFGRGSSLKEGVRTIILLCWYIAPGIHSQFKSLQSRLSISSLLAWYPL